VVANRTAIAIDADAAAAFDRASNDLATGDRADAANGEDLLDQGGAHILDALFRLELAFQQRFDVVGELVDDVVAADFDASLVGQSPLEVFERDASGNSRQGLLTVLELPRIGQLAGLADIFEHVELVAGVGRNIQAGDVDRHAGAGFLDPLPRPERVVHRLHA